jgi:hypothetical protein
MGLFGSSGLSCPLCENRLPIGSQKQNINFVTFLNCTRCGPTGFDEDENFTELERIVGYRARKDNPRSFQKDHGSSPIITQKALKPHLDAYPDLGAIELLNEFLSNMCLNGGIGIELEVDKCDIAYFSKARSYAAAEWCVYQAQELGWLYNFEEYVSEGFTGSFQVSESGWRQFYKIQGSRKNSRRAFMALSFSNQDLKIKVLPSLKDACRFAGYELVTVDENRTAGSIDDKIRVDIRNSRFLVVDLSDQNPGAYFEAGFAEGLGKPVFYICDKDVFDAHHDREGGRKSIHFDIEHHDIITWEKNSPTQCAHELLASIRNTLPDEAIMD